MRRKKKKKIENINAKFNAIQTGTLYKIREFCGVFPVFLERVLWICFPCVCERVFEAIFFLFIIDTCQNICHVALHVHIVLIKFRKLLYVIVKMFRENNRCHRSMH